MVELINVGTDTAPKMVDPRGHPNGTKHELTRPGSHIATQRGYASGSVIEVGEPVPHGIPVAEEWMAEAPKAEKAEKAEKAKAE
jgi:hypothetical protein